MFDAPWWKIRKQFKGLYGKEEETIYNNQLRRIESEIGIVLPPHKQPQFKEPATDLNGSFFGCIQIFFDELLSDEDVESMKELFKNADQSKLWNDGCLYTELLLILEKDVHKLLLMYRRNDYGPSRERDGFRVHDYRDISHYTIEILA